MMDDGQNENIILHLSSFIPGKDFSYFFKSFWMFLLLDMLQ